MQARARCAAAFGAVLFLMALGGCQGADAGPARLAAPADKASKLLPAEAAYVEQTAATLYRHAAIERGRRFLFSASDRYGVCVRSPTGAGEAADYTLLILQRRITEDFIPQAADDVIILRARNDVAPCRRLASDRNHWIAVR